MAVYGVIFRMAAVYVVIFRIAAVYVVIFRIAAVYVIIFGWQFTVSPFQIRVTFRFHFSD